MLRLYPFQLLLNNKHNKNVTDSGFRISEISLIVYVFIVLLCTSMLNYHYYYIPRYPVDTNAVHGIHSGPLQMDIVKK